MDADLTATKGKNFSHAAIKNKVLAKNLKLSEDKMKNVIKMIVLSGFFVIGFYGSAFSDSIHPMLYSELSFHDAYRYQHNAKESSNAVFVASNPSVGHAHTGVSALSFHDAYRYQHNAKESSNAVVVASSPSVGHAHTGVSALSFHDAYRYQLKYSKRCNNTANAGNEPAKAYYNDLICSR